MTRETVTVPPTPYPTGKLWWLRNGNSWHAPAYNNFGVDGKPLVYLPNVKNQFLRDFCWFCRNPAGNLVGFVLGFEGSGYTVTGPTPVLLNTWRDLVPPKYGWKWAVLNGWAPFVSYNGSKVEFYSGWRPNSGGIGFKFILKTGNRP